MSVPERDARIEGLLEWAMREADRGLAEALARVRREPAPAGPVEDPGRYLEVHTPLRELRTQGGAGPALPLREGWVVAAGSEALPAADDEGEPPEGADEQERSSWTS